MILCVFEKNENSNYVCFEFYEANEEEVIICYLKASEIVRTVTNYGTLLEVYNGLRAEGRYLLMWGNRKDNTKDCDFLFKPIDVVLANLESINSDVIYLQKREIVKCQSN